MHQDAISLFANLPRHDTGSLKWMRYPPNILPVWVADMDFIAAPAIIAALHARVNHGIYGYSLPTEKLLATCCNYFARKWNWHIQPEWIVPTPGLGVAIHTVTRYLGDLNKGVLLPQPIYHIFRVAPPRAQRPAIHVAFTRDGNGWQLDPDAIEHAAQTAGGASVLMLCNPHNPNGKVFTRPELTTLAELALRHDWLICSDEVHADLILDEGVEHLPIAALDDEIAARCLTMQSPSKAFNVAGLNFAVMVIANPVLRQRYKYGASGQVIDQLNPLGMAAATAAWGGDCDDWLAACIAHLRSNRDLLFAAVQNIDGISMLPLPATYLAWLDVSALGLAQPAAHFEAHGLGMSTGDIFGDKDYMRFNFGCDRTTVELGIERLRQAAATV